MALVLDDRVRETSTTTGTGTLNLDGAVDGFQTFVAGVGNSNTTYYAIVNRSETEWELGLGTVTDASTDTLARTTVISSSNSDSAVSFSAGTKDVFVTQPASKAVYEDASADVTLPDDLILGSDSAVLKFGADSDTTLTHTDGTGLTLNSTNKLTFQDTGTYIYSNADGDLDLVSDGTAVDSINLESAGGITLDAGTQESGIIYEDDGTEMLRIHNSGSDVYIESKVSNKDIIFKVNDGGSATEVARFDGEVSAFLMASSKKLMLGAAEEYIYGDGTDIHFAVGSSGDINIPASIGLTFGNDGEKIEGDGTDLTISGNNINLTATADVVIPNNVGIQFGGASEKIEGDGTDLTISANNLTVDAAADIILDAAGNNVTFKSGGTSILDISNSSSDAVITSSVQDKDIIFKGDDGGSAITALTLDMSASGAATFNDKIIATELDISGSMDIDGTSNLDAVDIDGAVQLDATLTVGADDQGYDIKFFGDTASAYMLWDTSADDLVFAGDAGIDLAGDIDVDGTANLDNTDIDGTLAVDGTTISLDATTSLNIDNSNTSNGITIGTATSGVPISIGHATSEVTINDNLTVTGTLTLGSNAELTEAELEMLDGITAGTVAASKAVVVDSNKDAASFRNVTLTGELDAATLDISGNADIDGTTNLDAVDIDGNVQIDGTVTVGVDDTGLDVKFFGATSGSYALWDESADSLLLTDSTPIKVGDAQDMTLYHDGTNSYITNKTGALKLATETSGIAITIGHTTSEVTVADNLTVTGDFTVSGTTTTVDSTTVNLNDHNIVLDSGNSTSAVVNGGGITLEGGSGDDATFTYSTTGPKFELKLGSSYEDLQVAQLIASSLDIDGTITVGVDNTGYDVKFFGATSGKYMEWDESADQLDVTGSLDVTGDTSMVGTLTVGVDDTGHDVKFFGATSGAYMLWDESTDDLVLAGASKLYLYDAGGGENISSDGTDLTIASGAKINLTATSDVVIPANVGITFGSGEKIEGDSTNLTITSGADIALTATADVNLPNNVGMVFGDDGEKIEGDGTDLTIASSGVLNLAAGGTTNQIKVTDGAILPITDDDVDLGSSSYQFKNAYIDGTLEADAITIGGTAVTAGGATAGFALAMAVAL